MAIQNSGTNNIAPLILGNNPKIREQEIIKQDASRTVLLAAGTVMGLIAASQKWIPVTSATVANTDGSAWRLGILLQDISAAALAAADVTAMVLIGDAIVDSNLLVFDKGSTGSLTAQALTTTIGSGVIYATTIQERLEGYDIFAAATVAASAVEN
jgi:hypothetical protein